MNAAAQTTPSLLGRLLARVGNPLNWGLADRCLLVAVSSLLFAVLHQLMWLRIFSRPEAAPYLDRVYLARVYPFWIAGYVGSWLVVSLAALATRPAFPTAACLCTLCVRRMA